VAAWLSCLRLNRDHSGVDDLLGSQVLTVLNSRGVCKKSKEERDAILVRLSDRI
jgi:hypothetical protein